MLINGQFLEGNMNPFPKAVGGGGTPQASCANGAPTTRARAPCRSCPCCSSLAAPLPSRAQGGGVRVLVARWSRAQHHRHLAVG
jgi:hypothetical protein